MPLEFKLPDLGEGVAEGEIVKWLVSEGDSIKEDQPMVEVMTDKATVEIPSPTTGTVKQILAKEGQTIKVGSTIVVFETGLQKVAAVEAVAAPASVEVKPVAPEIKQPTISGRVIATPATRKLARELNVDMESIRGTGPGGRITEEDVRAAASGPKVQRQVQMPKPVPSVESKPTVLGAPEQRVEVGAREEIVPLRGIRRRIAEKMALSVHTAAHVTHVDEVDFTQLIALREMLKPVAEAQGVKLTFLPFIMKAVIDALKEYPYFNASIDEEKQQITLKRYYNIGFATDTPSGLIVPVVKNADKKSLLEIAREIEGLSERAREGKVSLEEIQGGTFTITNIGTLGGMISTPIINMPEVAILGVHKIQKKPVVRDNQIVIRDVAFVSLSFDHRIVDGADSARFTTKIIKDLENPGMMFLGSI